MRTLRLLLAVGLGLAPALAAAAAGTTPAFAGGGAGMTLTATMDGQNQRLLVGTKHTVHITLADTPGEADLRNITVSLSDLDPAPLPVTCPAGQNGHLSLEPDQSLQCTAPVIAAVGFRTLVVRATAHVPSEGTLVRTAPLHYNGFLPPPPPPPRVPVLHLPVAPAPAAGRPVRPPTLVPTPPLDPPAPVNPPAPASGNPVKTPVEHGCAGGSGPERNCCGAGNGGSGCCADKASADKASSANGCCGSHASECCAEGAAGSNMADGCCSGHMSSDADRCCGSTDKPGNCVKRGGLAFTGMSTPMLAGAASGGLVLVAGGLVLVRRFARR